MCLSVGRCICAKRLEFNFQHICQHQSHTANSARTSNLINTFWGLRAIRALTFINENVFGKHLIFYLERIIHICESLIEIGNILYKITASPNKNLTLQEKLKIYVLKISGQTWQKLPSTSIFLSIYTFSVQ